MVIYNLPNDFNSAGEQDKPVIIRSYQATSKSANNKSIIHQNMVDIIIAGKKTIIDVYNITSLEAGELMILSKGSSLISRRFQNKDFFITLLSILPMKCLPNFGLNILHGIALAPKAFLTSPLLLTAMTNL